MNPMDLKRGIDKAVEATVEQLKKFSKPHHQQRNRPGRRHFGECRHQHRQIIAEAMDKVGKEGVITVEDGKACRTSSNGRRHAVDRGYLSPYFINNAEKRCRSGRPLHPPARQESFEHPRSAAGAGAGGKGGQTAADVAEEVEVKPCDPGGDNIRGISRPARESPGFGDRRKACSKISRSSRRHGDAEELGLKLENATLKDLGRAKRIEIEKENTTLIDGAGEKKAIEARVKNIRTQIDEATSDYDKEKLQERVAKSQAVWRW